MLFKLQSGGDQTTLLSGDDWTSAAPASRAWHPQTKHARVEQGSGHMLGPSMTHHDDDSRPVTCQDAQPATGSTTAEIASEKLLGPMQEHRQPLFVPTASYNRTDREAAQETASVMQHGQHIHWMPVFCQIGQVGGCPGAVAGSPEGPWAQSMASMGSPGGLQSYPFVAPQSGRSHVVDAATAATQAKATKDQSCSAAVTADAAEVGSSLTHDMGKGSLQPLLLKEGQAPPQAGKHGTAGQFLSEQQNSVNASQPACTINKSPSGMAACLPKLEKQLSSRSCEDLTARAVAKLWGVNLRRYTGHDK